MSSRSGSFKISTTPIEELSYEQAFHELEGIVAGLESEENTLDECMALFERGQGLIRYCSTLLDQAELKVQELCDDSLSEYKPIS